MFYRKHDRVTFTCSGPSMTRQSFKDECDIHKIVRSYSRTGIISHVQSQSPSFIDLPSDLDFQSSLDTVMRAEDAFSALPASVRHHFGNSAFLFLAAFHDPGQRSKLEEFGLLKPKDASSSGNDGGA